MKPEQQPSSTPEIIEAEFTIPENSTAPVIPPLASEVVTIPPMIERQAQAAEQLRQVRSELQSGAPVVDGSSLFNGILGQVIEAQAAEERRNPPQPRNPQKRAYPRMGSQKNEVLDLTKEGLDDDVLDLTREI